MYNLVEEFAATEVWMLFPKITAEDNDETDLLWLVQFHCTAFRLAKCFPVEFLDTRACSSFPMIEVEDNARIRSTIWYMLLDEVRTTLLQFQLNAFTSTLNDFVPASFRVTRRKLPFSNQQYKRQLFHCRSSYW